MQIETFLLFFRYMETFPFLTWPGIGKIEKELSKLDANRRKAYLYFLIKRTVSVVDYDNGPYDQNIITSELKDLIFAAFGIMPEFYHVEDGEPAATYVSIPRGGPIYVPDMVGPITRVPNFEALVFHELQDLEGELSSDQLELFDTDILVDELKIIDEEELVNKAFEEAFKDVEVIGTSSQIPEQQSNIERVGDGRLSYEQVCLERPGRGDDALDPEDPNGSACKTNDAGELNQKKRKRKRRVNRSNQLEGSYIAKVEQLARIKQKQDEDKAAAKLHSFNGSSCQINECGTTSFAKTEKIRSLKSISSSTKVKASNTHEYVPVSYPEVVLCVEIYHNKRTWSKTQEFLVLGQQFLTELRDKIYCLTDHVMKKAGQYDPSGYFLIEDVFCNDLREPSSIDYSKPILDWIENSKDEALKKWECIISGELRQKQKALLGSGTEPRLPKFKAVDMHKARFCDLRFRLGAGYVYCHQGDCKHIMVIRDMRLIHPEDVQNRTAYPLVTFQLKLRFHKCSVCKIYGAEKVTVDDKWAAEDPSYFCGLCYYMLHYQNGSLLYDDFSVFDYHHD